MKKQFKPTIQMTLSDLPKDIGKFYRSVVYILELYFQPLDDQR